MKILKEIDKFLEKRSYEREMGKVRSSHHPSETSSCNRAIVYKWLQAPITNPNNADSIWRMEMGKAVELLALEYLKEMGLEVDGQEEITLTLDGLEYPVHGYIDLLINKGGTIRGEIKTTWGYGTTDVSKNGPREQDIAQAKCYMLGTNTREYNMIYIARDTLWRYEYVITMTDSEAEKYRKFLKDKFSIIERCVKDKTIPPRDFKAVVVDGEIKKTIQRKGIKYNSDWQCMYCVRRDYCYQEEIKDYGLHL